MFIRYTSPYLAAPVRHDLMEVRPEDVCQVAHQRAPSRPRYSGQVQLQLGAPSLQDKVAQQKHEAPSQALQKGPRNGC